MCVQKKEEKKERRKKKKKKKAQMGEAVSDDCYYRDLAVAEKVVAFERE